MELLTVETRSEGEWTVVRAVGQLDVATAPPLRQTLLSTQYGGAAKVVLELDELEFIDSFGLGVLVGAVKRAATHDGEVALVVGRDRVRHVLEVSGLDRILHLVDSVAEVTGSTGGAAS